MALARHTDFKYVVLVCDNGWSACEESGSSTLSFSTLCMSQAGVVKDEYCEKQYLNQKGCMMSFLSFLKKKRPSKEQQQDRGIQVFENTSEFIRAENALRAKGWDVRVMGPPPEIRTGCDLVIEFPLREELNVLRVLEINPFPH